MFISGVDWQILTFLVVSAVRTRKLYNSCGPPLRALHQVFHSDIGRVTVVYIGISASRIQEMLHSEFAKFFNCALAHRRLPIAPAAHPSASPFRPTPRSEFWGILLQTFLEGSLLFVLRHASQFNFQYNSTRIVRNQILAFLRFRFRFRFVKNDVFPKSIKNVSASTYFSGFQIVFYSDWLRFTQLRALEKHFWRFYHYFGVFETGAAETHADSAPQFANIHFGHTLWAYYCSPAATRRYYKKISM